MCGWREQTTSHLLAEVCSTVVWRGSLNPCYAMHESHVWCGVEGVPNGCFRGVMFATSLLGNGQHR